VNGPRGTGTICYWNDGAARIFGYRAEELLGSTLDAIIPERFRQRHNEAFRAAIVRGSPRYGTVDPLDREQELRRRIETLEGMRQAH